MLIDKNSHLSLFHFQSKCLRCLANTNASSWMWPVYLWDHHLYIWPRDLEPLPTLHCLLQHRVRVPTERAGLTFPISWERLTAIMESHRFRIRVEWWSTNQCSHRWSSSTAHQCSKHWQLLCYQWFNNEALPASPLTSTQTHLLILLASVGTCFNVTNLIDCSLADVDQTEEDSVKTEEDIVGIDGVYSIRVPLQKLLLQGRFRVNLN